MTPVYLVDAQHVAVHQHVHRQAEVIGRTVHRLATLWSHPTIKVSRKRKPFLTPVHNGTANKANLIAECFQIVNERLIHVCNAQQIVEMVQLIHAIQTTKVVRANLH